MVQLNQKLRFHEVVANKLLVSAVNITPLSPANEELAKDRLDTLLRSSMEAADAIQTAEELSVLPSKFIHAQQRELAEQADELIADLRARARGTPRNQSAVRGSLGANARPESTLSAEGREGASDHLHE